MTMSLRPYRKRGKLTGGYEVDIDVNLPGLPRIRHRLKAPGDKCTARKYGESIERYIVQYYANRDPREGITHDLSRRGKEAAPEALPRRTVPTLAESWPRYMKGHCVANRLSPATMLQKETYYTNHLGPAFRSKPLDEIGPVDVQAFKGERTHLATSTVNVGLKHLAAVLNKAVEWGVIEKAPKVKLIREKKQKRHPFYDFDQFDRLVLAAEHHENPVALLVVLLGGEAGLRVGEILG